MTSPHIVLSSENVEMAPSLTAEDKAEVRKYLRERIQEEVREIRAAGTNEGK